MKVLILLSILAMAFAKCKRCGKNECYSECGTSCPLTCDNYLDPPKACTADCRIGCQCKKGFVRSCDGLCVKPEDCPVDNKCGKNERYTECGTSCPLTCENFHDPPKICNMMCFIGCECDDGFVKSSDGRCIRPEECQKCGENERYNECGTACPLTCENFRNPPKFCIYMCKIGCECKPGYVRTAEGKCVKPKDCPVPKNCFERPKSGPCIAYIPMFYYDKKTGTCEQFIYGGCDGNGNRYATEEECMARCGNPCQQEKDAGPCAAAFPKYFYSKDTGECEKFIYGGCGGNSNNFDNKKACESACCSG